MSLEVAVEHNPKQVDSLEDIGAGANSAILFVRSHQNRVRIVSDSATWHYVNLSFCYNYGHAYLFSTVPQVACFYGVAVISTWNRTCTAIREHKSG